MEVARLTMSNPKSYGQYCPMSRTLNILGERWSLLIVRDLLFGFSRFNDLARSLPGLSRGLLAKRLRQLEMAGIVERLGSRYLLTEAGQRLEPVVDALSKWGAEWTFGEPEPDELDPAVLVWWMHARLDTSGLPGKRHVFHVRFTDDPQQFWIVAELGEPSVCVADPGFDVDVQITSDVSSLFQVWLGQLPLREAMRTGRVVFAGPAALTRRMPGVLRLSPLAQTVEANRAEPDAGVPPHTLLHRPQRMSGKSGQSGT
jgi:DNA-binding HxlR family transcriptional regulator